MNRNDFDPTLHDDIRRMLELNDAYPDPPADLEALVVNAIRDHATARRDQDPDTVPVRRSLRQRIRRVAQGRTRWALAAPVVALVGCCIAFAMVLDARTAEVNSLRNQLVDMRDRPKLTVLSGASISSFGPDVGFNDRRTTVSLDSNTVVVRDAPAPPKGMAWHVWQVDTDNEIRAIGTIEGKQDVVRMELDDISADELRRIIVTTEPITDADAIAAAKTTRTVEPPGSA